MSVHVTVETTQKVRDLTKNSRGSGCGKDPHEIHKSRPVAKSFMETAIRFVSLRISLHVAQLVPLSVLVFAWELSCAGFRHSAGFQARVILDGAACRLGEPGDVHDVLVVL